jgi:hypothetical protein
MAFSYPDWLAALAVPANEQISAPPKPVGNAVTVTIGQDDENAAKE